MEIFTIGFTQSSAEHFFGRLRAAHVKQLMDVRLNNTSQLATFAKRDDLQYFLAELCGAAYIHEPLLAPTQEMLISYRKQGGGWPAYEERFMALMHERKVEQQLERALFATPTVLLCSEATPERCHRRLVIEYLQQHWDDLTPVHL